MSALGNLFGLGLGGQNFIQVLNPRAAFTAGLVAVSGGSYLAVGLAYASVTYGEIQAKKAAKRARDAFNASLTDRFAMVKSATATRTIVYGRARVSGPIVFAHSSGPKSEYLHLVIALAGHECDAVEAVYLNDIALPTPNPSTGLIESGEFTTPGPEASVSRAGDGALTIPAGATVTSVIWSNPEDAGGICAYTVSGTTVTATGSIAGRFGATITVTYTTRIPLVRVRAYLGTATQAADADLIAESGGKWTAAHQLRGITYLAIRLEYNNDVFGQVGLPNVSAVIRGKKVRDSRTGTTAWTDNAALCLADYLRDATYGMQASAPQVPDAEISAAANICDELVTLTAGGTTERRYTANGVLDSATAVQSNLNALVEAMAGECIWSQGRWLVRAGAHRAASLTITESMLADSAPTIQPYAPRSALVNRVTASYAEPSLKYQSTQAPTVVNATYTAQDGGLDLPTEITLDMVQGSMRAQRLAKIDLERRRQALTVRLSCNLQAYDLSPSDTVALTLARYGWSGKLFTVLSRRLDPASMTIELSLQETASAVWDWSFGIATLVDLTPNTSLPSPFQAPGVLTGVTAASGTAHLLITSTGELITRALVSWDAASTDAYVDQGGRIEVEYALASPTPTWQAGPVIRGDSTSTYIEPLVDAKTYLIRVRARNLMQRAGPWATIAHTVVGKSAPPSDVTGLTAAADPGGLRIQWQSPPDADYLETEVRYGASWASSTLIWVGNATTHVWTAPPAGSVTVLVRHRDTSGNLSAGTASATATIGAAAPFVSAAWAGPNEVLMWTSPPSALPVTSFEIRYGATFAGGTSIGTIQGTTLTRRADYLGTRTYWVAAIDASGAVGAPGSVVQTVAAPGAVGGRRAEVVDNNALLFWTAPTTGTLPIADYDVRKGATFAGSTDLGSNAISTFSAVFEQSAGAYTYWIVPIDTAGNQGTPASISATISQPPDFVLRSNIDSTFTGTRTNLALVNGDLVGPANTTETWQQHFVNNGYATPSAQIAAGNGSYLAPSLTTASYDESFDAGVLLPPTVITATLSTAVVSGTVSTSVQIYYRTLATDAWTAAAPGTSVLAPAFRYYRVVVSLTAAAGNNLLQILNLNVRLSVKLKSDSGTGTITNATTGVTVPFGVAFLDADTPLVQPQGSTPLIPVVNFSDVPNPTGFTVQLYTLAGVLTTGSFSWTARGY